MLELNKTSNIVFGQKKDWKWLIFGSRDDKIRTCDHTPPRRVLYRAELHPELRVQMYGFILK